MPREGNKFSVSGYVPDDTKTCFLRYFSLSGLQGFGSKTNNLLPDSKEEMWGKERKGRRVLNIVGRTELICLNSYIYLEGVSEFRLCICLAGGLGPM